MLIVLMLDNPPVPTAVGTGQTLNPSRRIQCVATGGGYRYCHGSITHPVSGRFYYEL